jgi:hypothetical protein
VLAAIRVKNGNSNGETRMRRRRPEPGLHDLTMVGSGNTLTLYRDGQQISTLTHSLSLSSIIPTGAVMGYLGRSLYQGDPLLRADVSDVKFWDVALTSGEVSASMPTAEQKKATTAALLRETCWRRCSARTCADERHVEPDAAGDGQRRRPDVVVSRALGRLDLGRGVAVDLADTPVTLTAVSAFGSTITFDVTVIAPTVSADLDAIVLAKRTTENLPLVTTGAVNGATITWTSSTRRCDGCGVHRARRRPRRPVPWRRHRHPTGLRRRRP